MSRAKFEEYGKHANEVLDFLKEELKKIRSGRANVSLVDTIQVDAYGQRQDLKNLCNISIVDANLITLQPWDKSVVQNIVKAIQEANIGINPTQDGTIIRLPLPQLTEERRKEYVKLMKGIIEEAKVSVRNLRKDIMVGLDQQKKDGELPEDGYHRMTKKLQEMVDESNLTIDTMAQTKEEELMKV
jgi:ribosome recycling factor